ncbi:MAG: GNAT family N-acetyltransferase [Planctomycetota bacterium]|nr:GNAT family N-acetyltransferase [Planctomycetota bacterium]
MPQLLESHDFSHDDLADVQDFYCGDQIWATCAAEWIKTPKAEGVGAMFSMARYRTKVWLYYTSTGLVGFGSLSKPKWPWPLPDGKPTKVSYIPQMAISSRFQGKPKGAKDSKFSRQIMRDLIAQASQHDTDMLCLHVHVDNENAIALYREFEFHEFRERDELGNMKMFRFMR